MASKAQERFEEEVKRLVKLVDVKLSLKSLRSVVEYEEALKSALASSAARADKPVLFGSPKLLELCPQGAEGGGGEH